MKKNSGQTDNEKAIRLTIGELALFALVAEIVNPTCPIMKLEAERVLFSDPPSTEMKQLCGLFGEDVQTLNSNIGELLKAAGVEYIQQNKVHG